MKSYYLDKDIHDKLAEHGRNDLNRSASWLLNHIAREYFERLEAKQ